MQHARAFLGTIQPRTADWSVTCSDLAVLSGGAARLHEHADLFSRTAAVVGESDPFVSVGLATDAPPALAEAHPESKG